MELVHMQGTYCSRLLGQAQRLERQPGAEAELSNKVHLLHEDTPSKLSKLVASSV